MNKCIICGKRTNNPSFCSEECVDIYDGEAPRKPEGFEFGLDSPDKKEDPGQSDYKSIEERQAYRDYD